MASPRICKTLWGKLIFEVPDSQKKKPQKRCESGTSKINIPHSVLQILAIGTC